MRWLLVLLVLCGSIALGRGAIAHDHDHPEQDEWYKTLMRPDAPESSCCSYADAYYADEVHFRNGKTYAVVTDDRPDEPLGRPHVPMGSEFEVPAEKLKWDRSNPTGHNVLFVSTSGYTWCFVQGSGI